MMIKWWIPSSLDSAPFNSLLFLSRESILLSLHLLAWSSSSPLFIISCFFTLFSIYSLVVTLSPRTYYSLLLNHHRLSFLGERRKTRIDFFHSFPHCTWIHPAHPTHPSPFIFSQREEESSLCSFHPFSSQLILSYFWASRPFLSGWETHTCQIMMMSRVKDGRKGCDHERMKIALQSIEVASNSESLKWKWRRGKGSSSITLESDSTRDWLIPEQNEIRIIK